MKRRFVLVAVALLTVVFFLSGCAKKTVLQEEKAVAPAPAKVEKAPSAVTPEEKAAKAARKKAVKEEAPAPVVKEEAPAPAPKEEVVKKTKKAKEAEAPAKVEKAKKAAPEAVTAKDLYEFADVHFDFDKFNLTDEARATLDKHAAWLNKNRNVNITIEGHCDERGTAEYNLALGQRRADAAAKYLTDMGVEQSMIKTISYGEERPQDSGHNEDAWAKNRRAHVIVAGGK